MKRSIFALLASLSLASAALGADATPTYTDANGKTWFLDHPALTPVAPPAPPVPPGLFGISDTGWETNAELGFSGSTGNTDASTLHAGLSTHHKDEETQTKADLSYDHTLTSGVVTQNRFVGEGTQDWFFEKGSRWGVFANLRYEYNDFNTWRNQVTGAVGPSYRILNDDTFTLVARAGLGFRYKDMGPQDNGTISPEGQFGGDFSWKIDSRQKFEASTTFYPSIAEYTHTASGNHVWISTLGKQWRNVTTASYNLAIDSTKTLKIAAEYDYDSTQEPPREKTDVKYWVTLGFKL